MGLVYISSTFTDLKEYREAAQTAIRHLDHHDAGMEHYQSGEQRPLVRCIEDVQRCDAYVGILGWRHGFEPPGHGGRSITQLEYEAAGERGIPRALFLCPDDDWPPFKRETDDTKLAKIASFRKLVRERHLVSTFSSVEDLKFKVAVSLKRTIGEGIHIPELLPFRCDRDDQRDDVSASLGEISPQPVRSIPRVCLLEGMENQAHHKFLQCLREDLGRILGLPETTAIIWKEIPWPSEQSAEHFERALLHRITGVLSGGSPGFDLPSLLDHPGPPTVMVLRPELDGWNDASIRLIERVIRLFSELRLDQRSHPLLVFIMLSYRVSSGFFARLVSDLRTRAIRASLLPLRDQLKQRANVVFVRELESIGRGQVETWCNSDAVQEIVRKSDLSEEIVHLFVRWKDKRIPMSPLAKELGAILRRHAGRTE